MNKTLSILTLMSLLLFTACSSDSDNGPEFGDLVLTVGETYELEADDDWESENTFIVTVKDNVLTAVRQGETYIVGKNHSFKVTVKPGNSDFAEPVLDFGCTFNQLKKQMTSYSIEEESDEAILYNGKGKVSYYMYGFEEGTLNIASMFTNTSNLEQLAEFLKERYVTVTVDEEEGYIGMMNSEGTLLIIVQAVELNSEYYYVVVYGDADSYTRSVVPSFSTILLNAGGEITDECPAMLQNLYDAVAH
ncbi:MAG: hypothetical protein IJZ86_01955 [Bacteroides sp.]|nr:hypothetical protein [Bacteroides sp.]